ncbi:MAG: NADP-reducing hydrogenase subunit HndC [Syntrophorhabdaceae bacterium PtaU1.Bin034]|nr:MAG: NADP-reducing hydrogenase subunit HndC [Syntrophorhabdaceae bacterium PtaU1.Bin034]
MNEERCVVIDKKTIPIEHEKNLLEVIRKAKIDLPTFCYHSELSVYGACRLCMVDVSGLGLVPACSTPPTDGMVVSTNTEETRKMRKIIVELLLANHSESCPTCQKSTTCQLQSLARRLGITKVRFKKHDREEPLDDSSPSLVRDPNKCVLCGDCVRICSEVQSVGAIDFAFRGAQTMVIPSFGKDLDRVECVNCGQCARICPTGALTPKSEVEEVWKALHDPDKIVVAEVAPAVRVAIGEMFGLEPGVTTTGQISAALRAIGFDRVFDTSFTADLTVIEEGSEFIKRVEKNENMPQFTSCCPAWVKFVEQYYPEFVSNLSTCRSPQQMFGALSKEFLSANMNVDKKNIVVVSIMPCTAKKFEAKRPEFNDNDVPDVDHVLTTQELGRMIEEAGLHFKDLEPEAFNMPFGFRTGAGVIFGNSGGVSEAVLRYVTERLTGEKRDNYEFMSVRGESGIRETKLSVKGKEFSLAVVNGLGNARSLIEKMKSGRAHYDLVEVMACPGGCIGGAGQPISHNPSVRQKRTKGIYENDRMLELHKSQDNPYVTELYKMYLGEVGGHKAHQLLHTAYKSRKRIDDAHLSLRGSNGNTSLEVNVCFGTSCFLKGSQKLLQEILAYLKKSNLEDAVSVNASFCFEECDRGPTVRIGDTVIEKCTLEMAAKAIERQAPAPPSQKEVRSNV